MNNLIWPPKLANLQVTRRASGRPTVRVDGTPRRAESQKGVTLLELVIVLFAIGVILGLSLPLASSLAGRFKVGSARDVFVNYYARARATAVQYGREARLHIDAADKLFWVEVDTGVPGAVATDTVGHVLDVAHEYGGVTIFSAKQVLCFDARGLPYTGDPQCESHDATVVFERLDKTDTVKLSLGGTVVKR